ncbi:MAG: extracellular substrate binding-like orphan protein GrrP [Synechococcaceae cyanobacterium]|jgi:polar amino acid transport system substrate-binding protein
MLRSLGLALLSLGLLVAPAARAGGVVERVARSGELRLIGPADRPPMIAVDAQGRPQGYGVEVAERIAALLSEAVGRPVRLRYETVADAAPLAQRLGEGGADLACGLPFTWARDLTVDFSVPIGISGLRLLAPTGRFDGSPAGLAGRRIGVVRDSLAESDLRGTQPAAKLVTFSTLAAAVEGLAGGRLDGVVGDSVVLAGLARERGLKGLALTPEQPYERYAVACALPQNDSAFRDLVNRAIVGLQQAYVQGEPKTVATVNRWLGPGSALDLPPEVIRTVFDALLLGVEALRPVPGDR